MSGRFAGIRTAWPWVPLLVLALVFSDAWLGGRVFYHRDLLAYWYPHMEVVRRLAAEGTWPWWNPFIAFGAPLFADPSVQLAYPPTWLALLLPPAAYFKLYVVGHCWLAAVGVHGLARRLGASAAAASLGGVAYCCSGPLLSSVSLYHHFAGACWMPAVLWALLTAVQSGTIGAAVRLGAAAAAQALAGSADLCFMTALAGVFLVALGSARAGAVRWQALPRLLALSVSLAAALAAIQWLPALALVADSARASFTPATNLFWSTHPLRLIEWFVPRLVADLPLGSAARAALFESREPLLVSLYLGVPAAVLAALGVVGGGWRRALGFAFFVLLALGRHTPILPLLLNFPPFGLFRFPEKYTLPASLFFAILVAQGADAWPQARDREARRRAAVVALVALALALGMFCLAGWAAVKPGILGQLLDPATISTLPVARTIGPAIQRLRLSGLELLASGVLLLVRGRGDWAKPAGVALGLALIADLVVAGRGVNPLAPASILEYRPPVLSALAEGSGDFRLFNDSAPVSWLNKQFSEASQEGDPRDSWARGNLDCLVPPSATRFGIRGSYDGDFSGLAEPGRYALGVILQRYEATPLALRLLQMGNVGHVVGLRPGAYGLPEVASFPTVFRSPLRLFRVPDPLPPAYVVEGVKVAGEPRSYEVMAGSFDPRREAIVAEGEVPRAWTPGFRGEANLVTRRADLVVVDARLSSPGLLVLVEARRRGWSVEVDGKPAPLLRANVLFRAVALPAGRHTVSFAYFPPLLPEGLALSVAAVLLGALALFRARPDTGVGLKAASPER